jgi:hypothetical protein
MALKGSFLGKHRVALLVLTIFLTVPLSIFAFEVVRQRQVQLTAENQELKEMLTSAEERVRLLDNDVATLSAQIKKLENEQLRLDNQKLRQEMLDLTNAYRSSFTAYEDILRLREQPGSKVSTLEDLLATILSALSKNNLKLANDTAKKLTEEISKEKSRLAALASVVVIPANVPVQTAPPSSGYSRQRVDVPNLGSFLVSIVAADLGSTRVIVDTASDGTCTNNCPVLPLATYVSRSGAYAGINGSYFCPASYPSCAGKTNSFDLLLMNKNKVYFNSDNNVYSNNPGVVFGGGYIRFLGAVSGWGRDTGIDGMISNFPLMVSGSNVVFGGDSDPKQGARGNRSFVANKGNTVYIGVVHGVTVAESARVLQTMGMENALNLDDGGSTALWSGGYKVGPGRDLPNVILFVRK